MTTFVFLGPSLSRKEAGKLCDARFLPPVAMGDLYTLVSTQARPGDAIAIIDGLFEQMPAVWHKEILHALSKGFPVYGASSMGALRAAELSVFGMTGVGRIFEAFHSGALDDDDEVAVAHADGGSDFRSLSTAMASIRFGLDDLAAAGDLPEDLVPPIVARLKALHYPERNWAAAVGAARQAGATSHAIDAIRAQAALPDAKAVDAMTLLSGLAQDAIPAARAPAFALQHTTFWMGLVRSQDTRLAGGETTDPVPHGELGAFFRAGGPERDRVLDAALLDRLVQEASRAYTPSDSDLRAAARRILSRNGLAGETAQKQWRAANAIGAAEWRDLLATEARLGWVQQQLTAGNDGFIVRRLKMAGLYGQVRTLFAAARAQLSGGSVQKPSLDDYALTPGDLQAWYESRFGRIVEQPDAHVRRYGFLSMRQFTDNLLKQLLAHGAQPASTEAREDA